MYYELDELCQLYHHAGGYHIHWLRVTHQFAMSAYRPVCIWLCILHCGKWWSVLLMFMCMRLGWVCVFAPPPVCLSVITRVFAHVFFLFFLSKQTYAVYNLLLYHITQATFAPSSRFCLFTGLVVFGRNCKWDFVGSVTSRGEKSCVSCRTFSPRSARRFDW